VSSLTSIAITFNEAVTGVDADDLLINAEAAQLVSGSGVRDLTRSPFRSRRLGR
jgi:hypothetical protein